MTNSIDRLLETISMVRSHAPAQVAPVLERNNKVEREEKREEKVEAVKRGPGRPRLRPLLSKSVMREQVKIARSLPELFGQGNMRDTLNYIRRLTNTPARAKVDDVLYEKIMGCLIQGMTARQVSEECGISLALAHNMRREVGKRKRITLAAR